MIIRFSRSPTDIAVICRITISPIEYLYPIGTIVAYFYDNPIGANGAGWVLHFVIH